MVYYFGWSTEKADINLQKHGVSFDEASTVFGDPLSLTMPDIDHSFMEERFLLLGLSTLNRLLVISYSERDNITRLISAREATPRERRYYERGTH